MYDSSALVKLTASDSFQAALFHSKIFAAGLTDLGSYFPSIRISKQQQVVAKEYQVFISN